MALTTSEMLFTLVTKATRSLASADDRRKNRP